MEKLISRLQVDFPALTFAIDTTAHWSPQTMSVHYADGDDNETLWGTLHELGHALLGHQDYTTDLSLLEKEVSAWSKAELIASNYGIVISPDHIQDCLDTYRNWLHKRSTCPQCQAQGIQDATKRYSCLNCRTTWDVSDARFCRPYRRQIK